MRSDNQQSAQMPDEKLLNFLIKNVQILLANLLQPYKAEISAEVSVMLPVSQAAVNGGLWWLK